MKNQEEINQNNTAYISLQQAAGLCPYSQDYLSLRARQGKLKAIKLGRNWLTKRDWLDEYIIKINGGEVEQEKKLPEQDKVKEFISLHKAAEFCQYGQDYLSLRARQGKLKAVKLGRNWVTKKEWLEQYIIEVNGEELPIQEHQLVWPDFNCLLPKLRDSLARIKSSFAFPLNLARRPATIAVCALVLILSIGISFGFKYQEESKDILSFVSSHMESSLQKSVNFISSAPKTAKNLAIGYAIRIEKGFKGISKELLSKTGKAYEQVVNRVETASQKTKNTSISLFNQIKGKGMEGAKLLPESFSFLGFQKAQKAGKVFSQGFFALPGHLSFYLEQDLYQVKQAVVKLESIETSIENRIKQEISLSLFYEKSSQLVSFFCSKIGAVVLSLKASLTEGGKGLFRTEEALQQKTSLQLSRLSQGGKKTISSIKLIAAQIISNSAKIEFNITNRLAKASQSFSNLFSNIKRLASNLGQRMATPFKALGSLVKELSHKIASIFKREKEPTVLIPQEPSTLGPSKAEEQPLPKPEQKGLVAIPSKGELEDEATIKQIKESFSDEVKVTPKDKTSGIIVPVFREKEGSEYLYIMVPVND